MAESVSANTEGKRKRRDSAGEVPGEEPQAPKTLPNLATDNDFQRFFALLKAEDRKYDEVMTDIRAKKEAAKASLEKLMSDAVDALKSRGIKKHVLRDMIAMGKRKEADIRADFEAQIWAMRAAGFPIGKQLIMFDEEFANQDEALRRAEQRGRDDFSEGKPDSGSPYGQNGPAAQAYLKGYNAAGAESLLAKKN